MYIALKVGEFIKRSQVIIDKFLVRCPSCCTVNHSHDLGAGDVYIRLKATVRITVEPFFVGSVCNVVVSPVAAV